MAEAVTPHGEGRGVRFTHVRSARSDLASYVADQTLSRGNQGALSWSRVAPGEATSWTLVRSSQERGVSTSAACLGRTLPGASRLDNTIITPDKTN